MAKGDAVKELDRLRRIGVEVDSGPIGISPTASTIFYGYDGAITSRGVSHDWEAGEYLHATDDDGKELKLTPEERQALADMMIERWRRWAKNERGDLDEPGKG